MGLFLFRADGVGETRTLSGTSLARGIYEGWRPGEHYPMVSEDGREPGTMGNRTNNSVSVSQETEGFKPLG
jgi:hypothetical protein